MAFLNTTVAAPSCLDYASFVASLLCVLSLRSSASGRLRACQPQREKRSGKRACQKEAENVQAIERVPPTPFFFFFGLERICGAEPEHFFARREKEVAFALLIDKKKRSPSHAPRSLACPFPSSARRERRTRDVPSRSRGGRLRVLQQRRSGAEVDQLRRWRRQRRQQTGLAECLLRRGSGRHAHPLHRCPRQLRHGRGEEERLLSAQELHGRRPRRDRRARKPQRSRRSSHDVHDQ